MEHSNITPIHYFGFTLLFLCENSNPKIPSKSISITMNVIRSPNMGSFSHSFYRKSNFIPRLSPVQWEASTKMLLFNEDYSYFFTFDFKSIFYHLCLLKFVIDENGNNINRFRIYDCNLTAKPVFFSLNMIEHSDEDMQKIKFCEE